MTFGNDMRIAVFSDNRYDLDRMVSVLRTEKSFEIVGVFNHFRRYMWNLSGCIPDVVLIDVVTWQEKDVRIIENIVQEFPQIRILVQTTAVDDERIYHSILAGASGFILKQQQESSIISSIKELGAGGSPMSPKIVSRLLKIIRENLRYTNRTCRFVDYKLTRREKDVLTCVVRGRNYKMTGAELNISYETVRSHMKNIYGKLNVASLSEVVAKAINYDLV